MLIDVVLKKCEPSLIVGKILAIFDYSKTVYFLVATYVAEYLPHLNVFYISSSSSQLVCCKLEDIYDYNPLCCSVCA